MNGEGRPEGALGGVLVGDGGAEKRHHSVPGELVDGDAVLERDHRWYPLNAELLGELLVLLRHVCDQRMVGRQGAEGRAV